LFDTGEGMTDEEWIAQRRAQRPRPRPRDSPPVEQPREVPPSVPAALPEEEEDDKPETYDTVASLPPGFKPPKFFGDADLDTVAALSAGSRPQRNAAAREDAGAQALPRRESRHQPRQEQPAHGDGMTDEEWIAQRRAQRQQKAPARQEAPQVGGDGMTDEEFVAQRRAQRQNRATARQEEPPAVAGDGMTDEEWVAQRRAQRQQKAPARQDAPQVGDDGITDEEFIAQRRAQRQRGGAGRHDPPPQPVHDDWNSERRPRPDRGVQRDPAPASDGMTDEEWFAQRQAQRQQKAPTRQEAPAAGGDGMTDEEWVAQRRAQRQQRAPEREQPVAAQEDEWNAERRARPDRGARRDPAPASDGMTDEEWFAQRKAQRQQRAPAQQEQSAGGDGMTDEEWIAQRRAQRQQRTPARQEQQPAGGDGMTDDMWVAQRRAQRQQKAPPRQEHQPGAGAGLQNDEYPAPPPAAERSSSSRRIPRRQQSDDQQREDPTFGEGTARDRPRIQASAEDEAFIEQRRAQRKAKASAPKEEEKIDTTMQEGAAQQTFSKLVDSTDIATWEMGAAAAAELVHGLNLGIQMQAVKTLATPPPSVKEVMSGRSAATEKAIDSIFAAMTVHLRGADAPTLLSVLDLLVAACLPERTYVDLISTQLLLQLKHSGAEIFSLSFCMRAAGALGRVAQVASVNPATGVATVRFKEALNKLIVQHLPAANAVDFQHFSGHYLVKFVDDAPRREMLKRMAELRVGLDHPELLAAARDVEAAVRASFTFIASLPISTKDYLVQVKKAG